MALKRAARAAKCAVVLITAVMLLTVSIFSFNLRTTSFYSSNDSKFTIKNFKNQALFISFTDISDESSVKKLKSIEELSSENRQVGIISILYSSERPLNIEKFQLYLKSSGLDSRYHYYIKGIDNSVETAYLLDRSGREKNEYREFNLSQIKMDILSAGGPKNLSDTSWGQIKELFR